MDIRNLNFFNNFSLNHKKQAKDEVPKQAEYTTSDCNLNNVPNSQYSKIEVHKMAPISKIEGERHTLDTYQGCLVGGAIGDALGWPIEFHHMPEIQARYGKDGITDLDIKHGKAEITDDTQMTIFTADGLLKSAINKFDENTIPDMRIVLNSYQDWLNTQKGQIPKEDKGWISKINDLYANRAPGGTCLSALHSGQEGSIEHPLNNSKGCGGVMRVAPVGLMYYKNPEIAFETGARCAALTHGHPSGYLSAGVLSGIIANLVSGNSLEDSVDNTMEILKKYEGHEDTLYLLEQAKELAHSDINSDKAIRQLGEGWCGDEAIAISVYCALKSPDNFEKALLMSVNHNGDSDSTGAITGNILGAYMGADKIPAKWKNTVELNNELNQLAQDLYNKPSEIEDADKRYIL